MRKAPADIVEKMPHAREVVARRITSEAAGQGVKPRRTELHFYVVTGPRGSRPLGARRLEKLLRGHWGIENRLHHVLDRTLGEDAQKTRVGDGPLILSLLRKSAMAHLELLHQKTRRSRPEIRQRLGRKPLNALKLLQAKP